MGYSTTFRLKGELDNQFKPIRQKSYTLFSSTPEEYECVLVAIVMKSGIENSKVDVSEIHKIYRNRKRPSHPSIPGCYQSYRRLLLQSTQF